MVPVDLGYRCLLVELCNRHSGRLGESPTTNSVLLVGLLDQGECAIFGLVEVWIV